MFGFLFLPLAIFWYQVVRVKKKKRNGRLQEPVWYILMNVCWGLFRAESCEFQMFQLFIWAKLLQRQGLFSNKIA